MQSMSLLHTSNIVSHNFLIRILVIANKSGDSAVLVVVVVVTGIVVELIRLGRLTTQGTVLG